MKVLMISMDRAILAPQNAVSERMKEYAKLVERLDIVLLSDRSHGLSKASLADNLTIHPTNSSNRFLRPFDAVKVGGKISADIITAQDPFECGWAGVRLKEMKRVPLEVQLHTNPFSKNFSGVLNSIRKTISKTVFKRADAVRVVLNSVALELTERMHVPKEKISVLPIFVDRSRISGEPEFDLHEKYGFKHVVLAVSRLSPEKNIEIAIKAIKDIPDIGLVIVGSGTEENKLRKMSKDLGIDSRVVFAGWQEKLSSFYKTADVFIQTSEFEGYGLSLVEAALSGLPVISTSVGVACDLENIQTAETPKDFETKIKALIADNNQRKLIGENLRKEVEATVHTKEAFLLALKERWEKLNRSRI